MSGYSSKLAVLYPTAVLLLSVVIRIQAEETSASSINGDITIGGLFPIHNAIHRNRATNGGDNKNANSCGNIYPKGLLLAEAMIYAVQQVNQDSILPYNITIGYDIRDTCNSLSPALMATLDFVVKRKRKDNTTGHNSMKIGQFGSLSAASNSTNSKSDISAAAAGSLVAVIGAGNSELSLAVNNILSLFKIPQVGYASSSEVLSDKTRYKTFLRVLPPDPRQAKALAKLVHNFGWNYISLVSTGDHYGGPLRESFKRQAGLMSICLAHDIVISYRPSELEINRTVLKLKETTKATVVLVFTAELIARQILESASHHNLTDRVWIASDSWSNAIRKLFQTHLPVLNNAFGIMFKFRPVPGFLAHLRNRLRSSSSSDVWVRKLKVAVQEEGLEDFVNFNKSGMWDDTATRSALARVSYVMDCMYALAHGVRKFCMALPDNPTLNNISSDISRKDECIGKLDPEKLLAMLFGTELKGFKRDLSIDDKGDPAQGSYDLYQIQHNSSALRRQGYSFDYVRVGSYETLSDVLSLNNTKLHWSAGKTSSKAPVSICSDVCRPGFYVVRKATDVPCCWECKRCTHGVSSVSNATSCSECPSSHAPNSQNTKCVLVPLDYLAWDSPWSISIILCALLSSLVALTIFVMFIKHRNSPVVRASSFEISSVLLASMFLVFLLPLLEIGKPTDIRCKASALSFAVIFALVLALILAKINRTVLVFTLHLSKSRFHHRYLLSSKAHFASVFLLVCLQVCICAAWFVHRPPHVFVTRVQTETSLKRYLHCIGNVNHWFLISSGFLILLSFLCTWLAFRSRNFPENYNHAKFISYAMFTFNLIWLTFMGAYYGAPQRGYHQEVIRCFAIILSNLCVLLMIYGPKLYVLMFRPDLNNLRTFREMTLSHALKSTSSEQGGSRLSMASIRSQGNLFVMDFECDPNEKAIQTLRILTRNEETQTESKHTRRAKLFSRLLRFGSKKERGGPMRHWSESDAASREEYQENRGSARRSIPLSTSAPQLCPKSKTKAAGNRQQNERDLHDIAEDNYEESTTMLDGRRNGDTTGDGVYTRFSNSSPPVHDFTSSTDHTDDARQDDVFTLNDQ